MRARPRLSISICHLKSLLLPVPFCSSLQIQTPSSQKSPSHQLSRYPQVLPFHLSLSCIYGLGWVSPYSVHLRRLLSAKKQYTNFPDATRRLEKSPLLKRLLRLHTETCLYTHAFTEAHLDGDIPSWRHPHVFIPLRRHAFMETRRHGDMEICLHRDTFTDTRPSRKSDGDVFCGRPFDHMGRKAKG